MVTKICKVICEDFALQSLFEAVALECGIKERFDVVDTIGGELDSKVKTGITCLEDVLNKFKFEEGALRKIHALIIVVDSDMSPAQTFRKITKTLEKAGYPLPMAIGDISQATPDWPRTAVITVPIGEPGNAESLCLRWMYDTMGYQNEVEAFIDNVPARDWSDNKQAKAKASILLSATMKDRPDCSFNTLCGLNNRKPDMKHESFRSLCGAIQRLSENL